MGSIQGPGVHTDGKDDFLQNLAPRYEVSSVQVLVDACEQDAESVNQSS